MLFNIERIFNKESVFDKLIYTSSVNGKKKNKEEFCGELVKVGTLRLTLFKEKGCKCIECGVEGTHFRVQRGDREVVSHLGLWTDEGVQMTKDHIIPRSKGGSDNLDNMQVMCTQCNVDKGADLTISDILNGSFK